MNRIQGFRGPAANIISESGLYKLILRSNKPEARAFQGWVTKVVIPAIRKDGMYITGEVCPILGTPLTLDIGGLRVFVFQGKIVSSFQRGCDMEKIEEAWRKLKMRPNGQKAFRPDIPAY